MKPILQEFAVRFHYPVRFTNHVFAPGNATLVETLRLAGPGCQKVLFVLDDGVLTGNPGLLQQIEGFPLANRDIMTSVCAPLVIRGGESAKNTLQYVDLVQETIHRHGICRQSFVIAVGGGALLDMVGYAAAIAHRGVRLIRIPTTALSQDDSGVGVKNSINNFGKKNFTGTFAPPFAVINDFAFLRTLSQRDWISGLAEAVKVALLKDPNFFAFLETNAQALFDREEVAMRYAIYRCAELHIRHIGTGGDPFETTSSRPLDFGHWAAHKLERLTDFRLRHGEAVAIGIALDTTYSWLSGMLSQEAWYRTLSVLDRFGFQLHVPELDGHSTQGNGALFDGLREFREHLGGELTITLLRGIGNPVEVHSMEETVLSEAIRLLRDSLWKAPLSTVCKEPVYEQLSC